MVSVSSEASVGAALRDVRLRRGLTLDAVADTLRIPPAQLNALEENDFSVFSAGVYARGAYLKYASYLGITDPALYQRFLRLLSCVRGQALLQVPVPATWFERMFTSSRILALGVFLVAVVIASYIGWHVQAFVRQPGLEVFSPDLTASVVAPPEVVVRGWAEAGAHVAVNGEGVLVGDDGSFETVLPIGFGINVIQVEARGASGNTHVIRRELLVPRNG